MAEYSSLPQQSQELKEKAEKIVKAHEHKKSKRSNWETHWQECMDYIIPRKNDIIQTNNPGQKKGNELFDSTAIMSNSMLASALHGMLTNPATRFFELIMGDPMLDDDSEVVKWLQSVAEKMFIVMNNSNFQTEIHEIYLDLGAIGTSCMYIGEDEKNVVHFAARPMKEIFVDENNLGRIDCVDRVFKWKPRHIVQEFGADKLPKFIVDKARDNSEEEWDIIHSVYPNDGDDKGTFQYSSCYVLKDHKFILSEGRFREFPYAVPRWTKTSGEVYGRGPGMDLLPDIKMINQMMKTTLQGAQLTVGPPMMVEDDGVIGRVRMTPFGVTVLRPGSEPIKPLITNARIDFGQQLIESIRKSIRSGFYENQLQLNNGPQMTATEVQQRTEENLRLMGPVLGRQHFEFLRPVIDRVFSIMERRELFPEPPQSIQGKKFDVRYSSLIARAQRMSEGQNISRAIGVAAPFIQMDPKGMDNLDVDKVIHYVLETYGVPEKVMRNPREIKQLRDARAQAQAQQTQMMQEQHAAESVGKVTPAIAAAGALQKQQGE